jgi:hypothetical protein
MQDYSYLGSGKIYIREYGAAAAMREIGNCSALSFSPQTNRLSLPDHTKPGGGTRNSVERVGDVELSLTFHDFEGANFADFLRGTVAEVTAGSVAAEALVAYKGGFTPLARAATAIASVEPAGGGTAYVEGTDYVLQDGGLFIPSTSTIAAPSGGAANIEVDYSHGALQVTQAFVASAKDYQLLFAGLNEARSGKRVNVRVHKLSGGVLQELGLLGEQYGAGTVNGALKADTTKGVGLSQYFTVEIEK